MMKSGRRRHRGWKSPLRVALTVLALGRQISAASTQLPTEFLGSHYADETERAAEHYGRGLRALRKAEAEKEPGRRTKHLLRAKSELGKAAGLVPNYDHFLALGQVYLALGEKQQAASACGKALAFKPEAAEAKECVVKAEAAPDAD